MVQVQQQAFLLDRRGLTKLVLWKTLQALPLLFSLLSQLVPWLQAF